MPSNKHNTQTTILTPNSLEARRLAEEDEEEPENVDAAAAEEDAAL